MIYDVVLRKKPYIEGLVKEEVLELLELLGDDPEVLPIEIEDAERACSAIGFITVDAASELDYDYNVLSDFVKLAMGSGGTDFNYHRMSVCVVK